MICSLILYIIRPLPGRWIYIDWGKAWLPRETDTSVQRRLGYPLGTDCLGVRHCHLWIWFHSSPLSSLARVMSKVGSCLFTLFYKSDPCKKIWQIKARLLEGALCFPLDKAQATEREVAEGAQGPESDLLPGWAVHPSVAAPPSPARQTHAHVTRRCSTDDSQPWRHRLSLTGEAVPLHICSNHSCEKTKRNPLKKESKKARTHPRHSFIYLFFNTKQCWEGIPGVGQCRLETKRAYQPVRGTKRSVYFCLSLVRVWLLVKNLPVKAGDVTDLGWVRSLGWEDPREEGMANLSSILVWRNPWTEEPGGLWSTGLQRVGHELKRLSTHLAHTVYGLEHGHNNSDSN